MTCVVLRVIAITSPISRNAFVDPNERTSTINDEMYPCCELTKFVTKDDVLNIRE